MTKKCFEICPASELAPGERRIKRLDGFSVGVFNVDGDYHAMKNDCPHQRAPLCEGKLTGTNTSDKPGEYDWERDGQIVTCPWHGWEFDITTGESVFNPHAVKAKTFETTVEREDSREDTSTSVEDTEDTAADSSEPGVASDSCESYCIHMEGDGAVETYDAEVESGIVVVYL